LYKNTIENDWDGDCIQLTRGVSSSDTYYGRYLVTDDYNIAAGTSNNNYLGGRGTIVIYDSNGNKEDTLYGGDNYGFGNYFDIFNGTLVAKYDDHNVKYYKRQSNGTWVDMGVISKFSAGLYMSQNHQLFAFDSNPLLYTFEYNDYYLSTNIISENSISPGKLKMKQRQLSQRGCVYMVV